MIHIDKLKKIWVHITSLFMISLAPSLFATMAIEAYQSGKSIISWGLLLFAFALGLGSVVNLPNFEERHSDFRED